MAEDKKSSKNSAPRATIVEMQANKEKMAALLAGLDMAAINDDELSDDVDYTEEEENEGTLEDDLEYILSSFKNNNLTTEDFKIHLWGTE